MIQKHLLVASILAVALCLASQAGPITIDFSSLANGTAVTNQYPGVVFSLQGGPDSDGPPTINSYEGLGGALANSTNPGYPTANILDIAFASPVSNVSFTFDNEGDNGTTFYIAYNASDTVVISGPVNISGAPYPFSLITVAGSGIQDLQINNGQPSYANWYFDIQTLTYTPSGGAVPEPASMALLLAGLGGLRLFRRAR